jgi:hypothetical protein
MRRNTQSNRFCAVGLVDTVAIVTQLGLCDTSPGVLTAVSLP